MKKHGCVLLAGIIAGAMLLFPGCRETEIINPLTGVTWILQSFRYDDQNIVTVERTFSLLFKDGGEVDMQVDCNTCYGTYVTGAGNVLYFTSHGGCTEIYCGDDSRDQEFHQALDTASRYEKQGNTLLIYFNNQNSILTFISRN